MRGAEESVKLIQIVGMPPNQKVPKEPDDVLSGTALTASELTMVIPSETVSLAKSGDPKSPIGV